MTGIKWAGDENDEDGGEGGSDDDEWFSFDFLPSSRSHDRI